MSRSSMISFIMSRLTLYQCSKTTWSSMTSVNSSSVTTPDSKQLRDYRECLSSMRNTPKSSLTTSSCLRTSTCSRTSRKSNASLTIRIVSSRNNRRSNFERLMGTSLGLQLRNHTEASTEIDSVLRIIICLQSTHSFQPIDSSTLSS